MPSLASELHPLDPCSAEELSAAVAILHDQAALSERSFFSCGMLVEPDKESVLGYQPGHEIERRVLLIGLPAFRRISL